jgi:hypothetical protein
MTAAPATTSAAADNPIVGRWAGIETSFPQAPGVLMVIEEEPDGRMLIESFESPATFCEPYAPARERWSGDWDGTTLTATVQEGECLGAGPFGGGFSYSWTYDPARDLLVEEGGTVLRRTSGRSSDEFYPSSPFAGTWYLTNPDTGDGYLRVVEETADGFLLSFYARSAWWCDGLPAWSASTGTLIDDTTLEYTSFASACGDDPGTDDGFQSTLVFDPATGTHRDLGDPDAPGWAYERTYFVQPDSIYLAPPPAGLDLMTGGGLDDLPGTQVHLYRPDFDTDEFCGDEDGTRVCRLPDLVLPSGSAFTVRQGFTGEEPDWDSDNDYFSLLVDGEWVVPTGVAVTEETDGLSVVFWYVLPAGLHGDYDLVGEWYGDGELILRSERRLSLTGG